MATPVIAVEVPETTVQSAVGALTTIPTDRYGIVRAHVKNGETFQINSVVVLSSEALDIAAIATQTNGTVTQAISSGRIFEGHINWATTPAGTTGSVGGVNVGPVATPAIVPNERIAGGPGQTISIAGSAANKYLVGYELGKRNTENTQTFKVRVGDTIQGGRYHLELYKTPGAET